MHGVALLLLAAAVAHLLSRRIGVPAIPVLILAGMATARLAPPPVQLLEDVLVLGVSFLLFLAGLELDPRRVRGQTRAATLVGTLQFVLLAVAGWVVALVLGFGDGGAAYLAIAVAASSTLVGVRLLQTRGGIYEPYGRLVLGVLLIQDGLVLASIPLLAAVGTSWTSGLIGMGGVTVLGGLAVVVRVRGARWLLALGDDPELALLAPLTFLFVFLLLGSWLGLPMVVGSFFAGVAMARFPVSGIVRADMAPLGDFFAALFFTALGVLAQPPTTAQLLDASVLALVVIVVTVPLVTMLAEHAGLSAKSAIKAALLLSQTSEISLIIGLTGVLQGHIDRAVLTVIVLVTTATMLLTPFIATDRVSWWLTHRHPSRRQSQRADQDRHVLLLGAGSTGMQLLEDLVIAGIDTVVVDDDPAVLGRLREAGIRTVRGDAADRDVLLRARADHARVIVSTIRHLHDNEVVLAIAPRVPTLVRVFDDADAHWVAERGGTAVLCTEASASALMEWMDREAAELATRLRERGLRVSSETAAP